MFWVFLALVVTLYLVFYVYRLLEKSPDSEFEDNSIDAFFIEDDQNSSAASSNNSLTADIKYKKDYHEEGRQILVMFGTEYGCSEEVAKLLYDRIEALRSSDAEIKVPYQLQPRLINARDFRIVDFQQEQACFVVISTSGDGVPPTDAREFCDHMCNTDTELSHLKFSVLSLGDTNYPQFCKTGRLLHDRFIALGGECVVYRHDVDMEDWSVINHWFDQVCEYLSHATLSPALDYIQHGDITEDLYSRHSPFMATLNVKKQLTVMESDQDKETIHCEFDISGSGLTWTAGDALGIYPENKPEEVHTLLQAMGCTGLEQAAPPAAAYQTQDSKLDNQTLEAVLLKYYDLKSVKSDLLFTLGQHLHDTHEQCKMKLLLQDGVSKSNESLQEYLADREVADVLLDFKSHRLPWQQIIKLLKSLQPRYYSISSSPMMDEDTLSVTVAVVRYTTLGHARTGVTTTYLQDRLTIGNQCPVFMSRNPDFRLPSNSTVPLILIGPGTGIAPFMAFIQERELQTERGEIHFYFGCRHKEKDFLYRKQLESWEASGIIKLSVAFSRDGNEKCYVQHLLHRDESLIWTLVNKKDACIYVCGDAKHMAHDVHTTLTQIVQGQGHMGAGEADEYLCNLEVQGRYQKDVWVV